MISTIKNNSCKNKLRYVILREKTFTFNEENVWFFILERILIRKRPILNLVFTQVDQIHGLNLRFVLRIILIANRSENKISTKNLFF